MRSTIRLFVNIFCCVDGRITHASFNEWAEQSNCTPDKCHLRSTADTVLTHREWSVILGESSLHDMTWEPVSRSVFIEPDVQGRMDSLGFCAFCFVQKMNLILVDKLPVLDGIRALCVSLSNVAMFLVFLLILVNTTVHHRRSAKPRKLLRRQRSFLQMANAIYLPQRPC